MKLQDSRWFFNVTAILSKESYFPKVCGYPAIRSNGFDDDKLMSHRHVTKYLTLFYSQVRGVANKLLNLLVARWSHVVGWHTRHIVTHRKPYRRWTVSIWTQTNRPRKRSWKGSVWKRGSGVVNWAAGRRSCRESGPCSTNPIHRQLRRWHWTYYMTSVFRRTWSRLSNSLFDESYALVMVGV